LLNKYSLPSSLACGLPSPAFIGNDCRIELSYSVNLFVGDQPIIQREMEGSDEGEVSLKELKDSSSTPGKKDGGAQSSHESERRNRFKKLRRSIGESSRLSNQVWSWKRASRGNYSFSTLQRSKTS